MYCTLEIRLQVDGDIEQALPKLQEAIDDIRTTLFRSDPGVTIVSPEIKRPLDRDDVNEHVDDLSEIDSNENA